MIRHAQLLAAALFLINGTPLLAQPPGAGKGGLEIKGYVVPAQQAEIRPKVSGHVIQLLFREGQAVKQAEVLARLDDTEYRLDLNLAEAKYKFARSRYEYLKIGGAPREVAMAEAELMVAEASVQVAKYKLDQAIIRAPFEGTILSRRVAVGDLVNPAVFQGPTSICVLANLRALEVECDVPEGQISKMAFGQKCAVRGPGEGTWAGVVSGFSPTADRAKGTVTVRVRLQVPEKGEGPRPESAVVVGFPKD